MEINFARLIFFFLFVEELPFMGCIFSLR